MRTQPRLSGVADGQAIWTTAGRLLDADDCARLVRDAREALGGLDAIVHCGALEAGSGEEQLSHEGDEEIYDQTIGTTLKAAFLINRAAAAVMVAQRRGQIVNLATSDARRGRAGSAMRCASMAGVLGLSESVAEEVRGFGVRVQTILVETLTSSGRGGQVGDLVVDPARVAEVVAFCLTLPADARLEPLVVRAATRPGGRRSRRRESQNSANADKSK